MVAAAAAGGGAGALRGAWAARGVSAAWVTL